jgi:predicted SAM-dependent methyltransferase
MKLNVGSSDQRGKYKRAEWVCLDLNPQGRPNVVGDGFQMPFADNTFEEIHSIHVLEHLPRDKWPLMLEEIFRVMKEGGTFVVEVPDFEKQCEEFLAAVRSGNKRQVHVVRTGIWGKSERPGMGHQYGFNTDHLKHALKVVGFQGVKKVTKPEEMISVRFLSEAVITMRCTKTDFRPSTTMRGMNFDQVRAHIIEEQ